MWHQVWAARPSHPGRHGPLHSVRPTAYLYRAELGGSDHSRYHGLSTHTSSKEVARMAIPVWTSTVKVDYISVPVAHQGWLA